MNNIDRAACIIAAAVGDDMLTDVAAQDLADAGLLAPDTDDITRLTIVNNKGRALEEWGINNLHLEIQDDGRTLKIFYTKEQA